MRHGRLHVQQRSGKVEMEPSDRGNQLASKKTRRIIDLETKMKVIRYYEGGKSVAIISRQLDMPHSTIATILRNREKVTEAVKGPASLRVTRLTKLREGPISDMENQLLSWIEKEVRRGKTLSNAMIKAKAKNLFDSLKEKAGPDCDVEFSASSGWFMRFKNRYSVDSVVDSISADVKVMDEFVEILGKVVAEDGYTPERIFTIAETTVLWKRVLLGSPNQKKSHGEAFKDKATVLLGGNAAGHKLKPCVIWHSDSIDSLEEIDTLPVHFKTSPKPLPTHDLFLATIRESYVSEIEKYCSDCNMSAKVVLIVNDQADSPSVGENVKLVCLPQNARSPLDKTVISAFRSYYLRRVLNDAVAVLEESDRTLLDFWKEYTARKFIVNLSGAWDDVPKECVIGSWKLMLPVFAIDEWNDEELTKINITVMELAEKVNANLDCEDADEVLEVVPEELTNVELHELESQVPEKKFTERGLSEFFKDLDKLLKKAEDMDPDSERFAVIKRNANAVFAEYREIYEETRAERTRVSRTEGTPGIGCRVETGHRT